MHPTTHQKWKEGCKKKEKKFLVLKFSCGTEQHVSPMSSWEITRGAAQRQGILVKLVFFFFFF